jgi:hypothetical protein
MLWPGFFSRPKSELPYPLLFTAACACVCANSTAQTFQPAALVAAQFIDWNGFNVSVDSFNSGDTNQSTGSLYDPLKAGDHGDVFANGAITNSIPIGGAHIYGHVHVGLRAVSILAVRAPSEITLGKLHIQELNRDGLPRTLASSCQTSTSPM